MRMARVLMMSTISPTIEQFNVNNINILQSLGYEVHIATDFTDESIWPIEKTERFRAKMEEQGVKCFQIDFSRSMFKIGKHVKAYRQLKKLMKENEYAFIHTHTPIASVVGRLVAHGLGIKVIYTAHGFHFYTGAPLKNWLIFYPIEWLCSWWTDVLITINKEDYARAQRRLHAKKTVYIPGVGIDTEKFKPRENGREKIRKELNLRNDTDIMLLSVGELNENKNHEAVIKALAKFSDFTDTDNVLNNLIYVIVGRGELKEHLASVAESLGVKLILTGYRNDVADFYDAADVYTLPSLREGLNVSLMEAMASSLAVTCSKIRGDVDLIDNEYCLFDPTDVSDIRRAISYAIKNKRLLGEQNLRKIKGFDLSSVQGVINTVYSSSACTDSITPPPPSVVNIGI